jgi:hypothetical protein
MLTCPSMAAMLAVLTMAPRLPSAPGSREAIRSTANRMTLKLPPTFTNNVFSNSASGCGPFFAWYVRIPGAICGDESCREER